MASPRSRESGEPGSRTRTATSWPSESGSDPEHVQGHFGVNAAAQVSGPTMPSTSSFGTLKIEADLLPQGGVFASLSHPRVVQGPRSASHCIKVPRVADDLKKEGPV